MRHTELVPAIALLSVDGIGDVTAKKLLERYGDALSVFKAKAAQVSAFIGKEFPSGDAVLRLFREAEAEADFIHSNAIKTWQYRDADYPERLKHCRDAPVLLYGSGSIDFNNRRMISIVGTRQITPHGIEFSQKLIADLAPLNPIIVSGLAYGTDIVAHLAAVENNLQTIGVVAHGLDTVYPLRHKKHISRINQNGGLLTEFRSGTVPFPENFVRRNRIVAGLSEATIVIESAEKGGSLITAEMAIGYNREVFAAPGRFSDKFSVGCLQLVKSQKAHLITSAADLVYVLNWDVPTKRTPVQKQLFVSLEPDEKIVYDYLVSNDRQLLDVISIDCAMPVFKLSSLLLGMELKGVVRPLPGKWFEAV